jgi:hypothetical protein
VSDRQILRSPLDLVVYGGLGLVCGGLPLIVAVALLANGDLGPGVPQAVLALIGLLALSALLLRVAWLRVILHPEHVKLVNPLRTYHIAWGDVEDIDLISQGGWFVRVWVNGRPIRAYGLSKLGRFGANLSSPHDEPDKDAPRWLNEGYQTLRRQWRRSRSRR